MYATYLQAKQYVQLHQIANYLIILLAFSIPLSTTLTALCFYSILFIWLIEKDLYTKWQFYQSYPLTKPLFFFIILSLLGMIYSQADWGRAFLAFCHQLRLGFIPLLAYYIHHEQSKDKKLILVAFVSAMILTVICTLLKVYGHIPIGQRTYGNDVFKNHIVISYFMANALLFLWVWLTERKQDRILVSLLIGLILYYLLFLNTGRIGYVMLFSSFAVFAWHQSKFKGTLFLCMVLLGLMLFGFYFSDIFSLRAHEFYDEFQLYLEGKAVTSRSSIGLRLEFFINSIKMFLHNPIMGIGTGSFGEVYQSYYAQQCKIMTNNPHNQYLKTAVELGLIGLSALIWLFYKQWKMTQQLTGTTLILAQGIFASFFIGCIFNSWLINVTESYFYYLMTAYFIAHTVRIRQPDSLHKSA